MFIPNPLEQSAHARPNHTALVVGDTELSYGELRDRVSQRAHTLSRMGVKPGDRVCISARDALEWVIHFHAIGWCNAVAVLIDPGLDADDRNMVLEDTNAQWLDLTDTADEDGSFAVAPPWRLEDPRLVVFSSGSTGTPKAIELLTHQLVFNAMGSAIRLGHHLDDRWLNCLPLFHIGGASILIRCAMYATTTEVCKNFDAMTVRQRLDSGEVTQVSLVPTMLKRLLDVRPEDGFHSSVRTILVGGGPCNSALRTRCQELKLPISLTWGLTEAASQVCTQVPDRPMDTHAVGPACPFAVVSVQNGRLLIDGPTVRQAILTSDLGSIREGQVYIHGRQDDLINSGGKKIDPQPIVHRLLEHPNISDALVLGQPCLEWGERVTAVLVSHTKGNRPSAEELLSWCRMTLVSHQIPKTAIWVDGIPRTPLGKRNRSALDNILRDNQANVLQSLDELSRAQTGRELRQADERVLEMHSTSLDTVIPTPDAALEGHGAPGEGGHAELGDESVTSTHGTGETRLGVHQREAQIHVVEGGIHATNRGGEHLLKTNMRVFKSTAKEDDPSAIDFVEPGSDLSFEKHKNPLDGRRTENR